MLKPPASAFTRKQYRIWNVNPKKYRIVHDKETSSADEFSHINRIWGNKQIANRAPPK